MLLAPIKVVGETDLDTRDSRYVNLIWRNELSRSKARYVPVLKNNRGW